MKVVRITEIPALEAGLARFDAWWTGLTRRERILLGTLAALLAGVVLVYGVIKPIQSARAEAIADIRTYETLNARILAAGKLTTAQVPQRTGAPESIISSAASSAGFAVSTQPTDDGVRATATDISYDSVLHWIEDVSKSSSLSVTRADISHGSAAGQVDVTVDFAA
ncbi:type II secretion system protein GspM [Stakelama marina]|uniref:Type II secretion system protein M n=1 Tax=Stakelama marina TaxID=2826939 RepID=A0A8T4IFI9_9SPHN|nr:type II secretion system protein GspM [Stakelama marina]MBR0551026.1 type II secretion system protein M [Stakelama marina]